MPCHFSNMKPLAALLAPLSLLTAGCADKPDQSICGVGTPYDDREYEKWRQMQIDAECPDYLRWKREQERAKVTPKP